jgi:hypothetical protein
VSDANDSDPVSDANDSDPVSDATEIRILKGDPTDAEIAAVVAVLAGACGAPAAPGPIERNLWGHPVDKLRYPLTSWQRVSMLERTHLRR